MTYRFSLRTDDRPFSKMLDFEANSFMDALQMAADYWCPGSEVTGYQLDHKNRVATLLGGQSTGEVIGTLNTWYPSTMPRADYVQWDLVWDSVDFDADEWPSPEGCYQDPVFRHYYGDGLLDSRYVSIGDVFSGLMTSDGHTSGVVQRMFLAYTPRGRYVYARIRLVKMPGKPTITLPLDQIACNLQDEPEKVLG